METAMLYNQIFKSLAGAQKRVAFERAHVKDGQRANNYRFFIVRCIDGKPDGNPFDSRMKYDYRIEKTLSDHPTDPRALQPARRGMVCRVGNRS
jgi:hypothetical protein